MSYCQKFIFISKITKKFITKCHLLYDNVFVVFTEGNKENEGEKKRKDFTNGYTL